MNSTILTMGGQQAGIAEGQTILSAMQVGHTHLDAPCNGQKTCGKCKVIVLSGNLSPLSEEEYKYLTAAEIKKGVRLACCAKAAAPLAHIHISLLSKQEIHSVLTYGQMPQFTFEPIIKKQAFSHATPETCGTSVHFNGHVAGVEDGDTTACNYGAAVDIGTTTVVLSLVDLNSGSILETASGLNAQTQFGADVLTRIQYASRQNGLPELQKAITGQLNALTQEAAEKAGIKTEFIYCFSVAANSTMMHMLLGVNPAPLAMAPYKPVFTDAQVLPTGKIGLTNCSPYARACCLPAVSAYVGADIVAGTEISGLAQAAGTVLFIDIGTNGELVLSRNGKLAACSCAAGPALEGMNIACGMRAAEGAIEHVSISNGNISISTIGGKEPRGICGSGVLEILSELLKAGAIDRSGKIAQAPGALEKSTVRDAQPYFLLPGGIRFTQKDIRQVQLAKGALLSGVLALLNAQNLQPSDLDRVIVAGQFGRHLSEESLIGSGILPREAAGKIEYIGNSSLTGAILALSSRPATKRMQKLAESIEYLELATLPGYSKLFMQCLNFNVLPK